MDDVRLVHAAQSGDTSAIDALVRSRADRVYRICLQVAGNRTDAEDLAHDSLVEAFVKLGQLREAERFDAWLRSVTLNVCRMWWRDARRRARRSVSEPAVAARGSADDASSAAMVAVAWSRLSRGHRLALELYYHEQLTYEEIASFLDVPVGTVMSRLHRGREKLREVLANGNAREESPVETGCSFGDEVTAEVRLLLREQSDTQAVGRLRTLFAANPTRLVELMSASEEQCAAADLALVLGRLDEEPLRMVLDSRFALDVHLRKRAEDVLRRYARHQSDGQGGRRAEWGAGRAMYVLVDSVLSSERPEVERVEVLLDMIESSVDEPALLLLTSAALTMPGVAVPAIWERYVGSELPAPARQRLLQALCRTGTLASPAVRWALASQDDAARERALAAAQVIARSVRSGDASEDDADENVCRLRARFTWKWACPPPSARCEEELDALSSSVVALTASACESVRISALRTAGLLSRGGAEDAIRAALEEGSIRVRHAALLAAADAGMPEAESAAVAALSSEDSDLQRAGLGILGRLGSVRALEPVSRLVNSPVRAVRLAAVAALSNVGGSAGRERLQSLAHGANRDVARAAATAMYARPAVAPPMDANGQTSRVRTGRRPAQYLSVPAALRELPNDRSYDEPEVTHAIAGGCYDYAAARRCLVDLGLMDRVGGVYRLTDAGRTMWRVERAIRMRYLA